MHRSIANVCVAIIAYLSSPCATALVSVADLTCEYLTDPLNVAPARPRLGWKMIERDHSVFNQRQTAYHILTASTPQKLLPGKADLWDSGITESSACAQIVYGGIVPPTGHDFYWKVRIRDKDGLWSDWSEAARWGQNRDLAESQWIGDRPDLSLREYLQYVDKHHSDETFDRHYWENPPTLPSPLLRKTFTSNGAVKKATLYASAIGCYEMWINGNRVGDHILAPEWTDYNDRLQFQTYDVSRMITSGQNTIGAILADGWALGRLAGVKWMKSFPHRGFYSPDRRLIARLEIEYADGTIRTVETDGTWKIMRDSHILAADLFAGQTVDARKSFEGWASPGYDDSSWLPVNVDTTVRYQLVPQPNEAIRSTTSVAPVRIWKRDGKYLVDFGQNIAGHCRLTAKGAPGDTITIRHGEWLNDDGSLYTQSLGYAKATDRIILSGGTDVFEPTFTYHGFQFVEISGLSGELTEKDIRAIASSSDARSTGSFSCSDERLNKLYRNIVWTQRNNMQSVLTDNPSRDERTGAMGDIQIFAQSSIFNMGMGGFYTKYVSDMKDTGANGQFYSMIPSLRNPGKWDGWIGAPGWCEAAFILPWRMYENYADTTALAALYGEMCRHIESTRSENPDLIWRKRHNHNGDWLNANTVSPEIDPTFDTTRGSTPDDLFATAFFAYSTRLLSEISSVLGREREHIRYGALADSIKTVFIDNFVNSDGTVQGDTQGAYSISLYFGLVPENLREKCFANLLRCIEEYGTRLSTGFISTPMMMQLLSDFGRNDIAYSLLMSERFPSWLYIVRNGASTVWERWDAWIPGKGFQNPTMNSLDHVAFGAVSEWMFRHILGINPDTESPGYGHFYLTPSPGGGLTHAEGSYDSIRGLIRSGWKTDGKSTVYSFSIPANTSATVTLPVNPGDKIEGDFAPAFTRHAQSHASATLGSGIYTIRVTKDKIQKER